MSPAQQSESTARGLRFEALESRRMLAPIIVTNLSNSAAGSLRAAVALADDMAGKNEIIFASSLFASGTPTITLFSPITVNEPVNIHSPSGKVVIAREQSINLQTPGQDGLILRPSFGSGIGQTFEVRDLVFQNFHYGIWVNPTGGTPNSSAEGIVVENCDFQNGRRGVHFSSIGNSVSLRNNIFLGTVGGEPPGDPAEDEAGIWINGGNSPFDGLIEANVIGLYDQYGISIPGGNLPGLEIKGNRIGTDFGTAQLANGIGIDLRGDSPSTRIESISDNVIAYNGIGAQWLSTDGVVVTGNTFKNNSGAGISISGQSNDHVISSNSFVSNGSYAVGIANDGGTSSQRIQISQNYFRDNIGFPIDLNRNGTIEANDYDSNHADGTNLDDLDQGPNQLLNYPEVDPLGIVETPTQWIVPVHFDSTTSAPFRIEFYRYVASTKEYSFIRAETPTLPNGDLANFFTFQKGTELQAGDRLAMLAIRQAAFPGGTFGDTSELVVSPPLVHTPGARIGDVVVKGLNWAANAKYSFAALVGVGQQLRPLVRQGADTIEIHFTGPVILDGGELTLWRSVRNISPDPNIAGTVTNAIVEPLPNSFFYDPITHTAQWKFATGGVHSLLDGKYAIHLSTIGALGGVTGGGRDLNAEWTNEKRPTQEDPLTPDIWSDDQPRPFVTGDGTAGTLTNEFRFHFSILRGDYDGDGRVEGAGESATGDGNGDGVVNGLDIGIGTNGSLLPMADKGSADLKDNEAVDFADYPEWIAGFGVSNLGDVDDDNDSDGVDFLLWNVRRGTFSVWYAGPPPQLSQNLIGVAAPRVSNVIISGSQSFHAPFSMDTVDGAGSQIRTVPVGGADTISIVFSEAVNIFAESLMLVGLRWAVRPELAEFHYDPLTNTATWRYEGWPLADQYLLSLSDGSSEDMFGVTDAEGNRLDGEWTNPMINTSQNAAISEFPSGNGTPGGMFNFVMTLLPGDANLDGWVDSSDYMIWQAHLAQDGGFDEGDFLGDGIVDNEDLAILYETYGLNYQAIWIGCDMDQDLDVDQADIDFIFGNRGMEDPTFGDGDLNFDGVVDSDDLDIALTQFMLHGENGLFLSAVW